MLDMYSKDIIKDVKHGMTKINEKSNVIKNYRVTQPKICQSCINSTEGKRGSGQLECKAFDGTEVHNYGTCPEWRERRG